MRCVTFLCSLLLMLLIGCTGPPQASPTPVDITASPEQLGPGQTNLPPGTVQGMVVDEKGQPVPDAVVRHQATENFSVTDKNGEFQLNHVQLNEPVSITAWAEGFYINNALATYDQPIITIEIHRFSQEDNPNYEWLTSSNLLGDGNDEGCAECHTVGDSGIPFHLPVDEWLLDAHSQSAINQRFLSTYNGTDVHGNQSPLTRFISANPYARNASNYNYVALAPDLERPYFGPGYKLDFPGSAGNCSNCHIPGAAAKPNMNFAVDVNMVEGVEAEGIFCDFCHKVWAVQLNEQTGLPDPNIPGVMSYTFRRPQEGHQFFAGPYDDVPRGKDTYSPIYTESTFCAPCHFGSFWDNQIYNSFGEWLDSPYSDSLSGQTCQDCHMPPTGGTLTARADVGAPRRVPETIFSHRMPGATDEELLQNAVSLNVEAKRKVGEVQVQIQIVNDNTGHHVPTDYPGRHLILLVQAYEDTGDLLEQVAGTVLPDWTGIGNLAEGYYAGLPGEVYVKLLQDDWTGYYPSVAYWNPNTIVLDNRIAAFEAASSEYTFESQSSGSVRIVARIFLRRSFIDLMDWKDWDTPDMLMEEVVIDLD